jgi:hypothetical protein
MQQTHETWSNASIRRSTFTAAVVIIQLRRSRTDQEAEGRGVGL